MKKESIPEWLCLGASFFFMIMAVVIAVSSHEHFSPLSFFMPLGFGLFMFLLSLIMNLVMRIEKLERLANVPQKEST